MTHRAAQPWEAACDGGNVIVDFKFQSPKVTWWFDHHQSAFSRLPTPNNSQAPRAHMFYEPDYKSCTKLIATIASEKFGFNTSARRLDSLGRHYRWAQYATPQSAVELAEPATQLALVIEAAPETACQHESFQVAYRPLSEW